MGALPQSNAQSRTRRPNGRGRWIAPQALAPVEAIRQAAFASPCTILENLLLLARADAGRLKLQREEFGLCEVLDGVCDDARALSEPNEITVETRLPAKLLLCADRRSLALIMQNLVENGIKYNGPSGRIGIAARAL